jgi:dsDNA-binding SOS-regulon protein
MKKSDDKFEWTEEADTAFAQLKKVLSTPPVLIAPKKKEPLLLYIAATHQVVSTVLVVKRSEEGQAHGVQRPVIFPQRSTISNKAEIPALSKACIQRIHNSTQATTIFHGASNHCG